MCINYTTRHSDRVQSSRHWSSCTWAFRVPFWLFRRAHKLYSGGRHCLLCFRRSLTALRVSASFLAVGRSRCCMYRLSAVGSNGVKRLQIRPTTKFGFCFVCLFVLPFFVTFVRVSPLPLPPSSFVVVARVTTIVRMQLSCSFCTLCLLPYRRQFR